MNKANRGPGVKCMYCGATLDYDEQCDCEQREADTMKAKRIHTTWKKRAQNAEAYKKGWEEYLYA